MRTPALTFCLLLVACAEPGGQPEHTVRLENDRINEASGLARSNIDSRRLWVINDGGAGPRLYAVGVDGSNLGAYDVSGVRNTDWEDLASFVLDGQPMLLIADIGDNLRRRRFLTLYVLHEPRPEVPVENDSAELEIAWQVDFQFPDGPVDAESVSVNIADETVLVLSKREIPAVLYEVPLRPTSGEQNSILTATPLGAIRSLPQPSKLDRDQALAKLDWHWQPTAMDISPSGDAAVILTYRRIYLYPREKKQGWYAALQSRPKSIEMSGIKDAEAITFSLDGTEVFVTGEMKYAPLLRFELE